MKITYDPEVHAAYIYFTVIGMGGVAETVAYQELTVDLDKDEQIVGLRLLRSGDIDFSDRLKYLGQHPEINYSEADHSVQINFAHDVPVKRSLEWEGNIDLDSNGQVIGLEMLFAPPDYQPDDGQERLSAEGKLAHIEKYRVPFDDVY
jgi:uncharacterized protein YuzE